MLQSMVQQHTGTEYFGANKPLALELHQLTTIYFSAAGSALLITYYYEESIINLIQNNSKNVTQHKDLDLIESLYPQYTE